MCFAKNLYAIFLRIRVQAKSKKPGESRFSPLWFFYYFNDVADFLCFIKLTLFFAHDGHLQSVNFYQFFMVKRKVRYMYSDNSRAFFWSQYVHF
jgi:hypothetical protein